MAKVEFSQVGFCMGFFLMGGLTGRLYKGEGFGLLQGFKEEGGSGNLGALGVVTGLYLRVHGCSGREEGGEGVWGWWPSSKSSTIGVESRVRTGRPRTPEVRDPKFANLGGRGGSEDARLGPVRLRPMCVCLCVLFVIVFVFVCCVVFWPPPMHRPKFRSSLPLQIFVLSSLSWGLLVEVWPRFKAMDHPKCSCGLSGVIV